MPPQAARKSPLSRPFLSGAHGEWSDTTTSSTPGHPNDHRRRMGVPDASASSWVASSVAGGDLETHDRLEHAISELPADWRFLISAHYYGGLQYQELADILETPIGTVKTHLHRAKNRLRTLLDENTVRRDA